MILEVVAHTNGDILHWVQGAEFIILPLIGVAGIVDLNARGCQTFFTVVVIPGIPAQSQDEIFRPFLG